MTPQPKCWIVTEGLIGTENQCVGVAQALGIEPETKRVTLNQPWRSLSPYLPFECTKTFSPPLSPPWPKLLITSGRKSIAVARYIKRKSSTTICVHIQDPRVSTKCFDLVAVPEHDPTRGDNVIVTAASPNKITQDALSKTNDQTYKLQSLPGPKIAVLIGGNSKAYRMTPEITERLCDDLKKIRGTLMITCSRRTGIANQKILEYHLKKEPNFFWNGRGENPYFPMLAAADFIVVTADSASMISESCSTGKPVYMIDLEGGATRIESLHENLMKKGVLRSFSGPLEPYNYEPLCDAKMVADEIKKRFPDALL